jgi:Lrp/AsnC family leucine-responsive transcriptional regulator
MIAGSFDYLLKVRSSNIVDYRTLLSDYISSLPYVASTSTFVSMQTIKG